MRWCVCSPAVAALAGLVALGCEKTEGAGTPTAGGASSATARADTAAGQKLRQLCLRMCDKNVECAGDIARQLAGSGGTANEAATKAVAKAKEGLAGCQQECDADAKKGSAEAAAELEAVDRCLAKPDCDQYMECMAAVGGKAARP